MTQWVRFLGYGRNDGGGALGMEVWVLGMTGGEAAATPAFAGVGGRCGRNDWSGTLLL